MSVSLGKGKVERPIDYLRERFWRGYTFSTIEKANGNLLSWLDQTANRMIQGDPSSSCLRKMAGGDPLAGSTAHIRV